MDRSESWIWNGESKIGGYVIKDLARQSDQKLWQVYIYRTGNSVKRIRRGSKLSEDGMVTDQL